MPTSLGGAQSASIKLHVKNLDPANAIKKGITVALVVTGGDPHADFLDGTRPKDYGAGTVRQIDIPYVSVVTSPVDGTGLGGVSHLGVAAADIKPGGYGEVITFGMAQVLFGGTVAVGEVITTQAGGAAIDAATASHKNPIGMALEAAVANDLKWALVNFLNWTGAGGAFYGGKAY